MLTSKVVQSLVMKGSQITLHSPLSFISVESYCSSDSCKYCSVLSSLFLSLFSILISLQELVLQETWLFHHAVTQNPVSYCCSSVSVQYTYSLVLRPRPAFHRLQCREPGNEATVHISWTNISCHAMQQFCYFEKQDLAIMRESTLKTQDKVILLMNLTPHMHFVHIVQGHQKMWGN